MADPISLSSGVLALALFAFQSSKTLYQAFGSFQNYGRNIRDLKEELQALNEVLQSLEETLKNNADRLSALKRPLFSCGRACEEFAPMVARCTAHSNKSRTSVRDWAKLSYMGKDIAGFRNLMAGYKSTIAIALGDANIRTAVVTADLLNEYKDMIKNTAADLEELLQGIDERINSKISRIPENSAINTYSEDEEHNVEEERASIAQCLRICEEVSMHINEVQAKNLAVTPILAGEQHTGVKLGGITLARLTTSNTLDDCKRGLGVTSSQLKTQLDDLNNRIAKLSQRDETVEEHAPGKQSMKDELESIKQCLAICTQATEQVAKERINVFEDVEMADDGQQVIVATLGDLISAKRITVGARSSQWLGQMSDASLQQLSRNRNEDRVISDRDPESGAQFQGRHGAGRTLVDLTRTGQKQSH